jgi:hypothetical protein
MTRFEFVAAQLAELGLTITNRPGEYCVNFRGGSDGNNLAAEHERAPPEVASAEER